MNLALVVCSCNESKLPRRRMQLRTALWMRILILLRVERTVIFVWKTSGSISITILCNLLLVYSILDCFLVLAMKNYVAHTRKQCYKQTPFHREKKSHLLLSNFYHSSQNKISSLPHKLTRNTNPAPPTNLLSLSLQQIWTNIKLNL